MAVAGVVTAEAGIRASYAFSGFSIDALIIIGSISAPMLVLAAMMYLLEGRQFSRGTLLIAFACAALVVGGIQQRYVRARDNWNAHVPNRLPDSRETAIPSERLLPIKASSKQPP